MSGRISSTTTLSPSDAHPSGKGLRMLGTMTTKRLDRDKLEVLKEFVSNVANQPLDETLGDIVTAMLEQFDFQENKLRVLKLLGPSLRHNVSVVRQLVLGLQFYSDRLEIVSALGLDPKDVLL
ncbi:uncharacterized protein SPPG_00792 [Spizellomyces punctatus DAOM BR117]|uniref:Uncharacterized protein n=1 Tax=Spizellomyces punctatus (strain DAOM BR117) TaxID=645134 RepID=A0A0L0HUV5_SPIPD|nr:uncharacterized protein SPPG_00792 [Spizellomyces punctatus DAOM BR117]KND05121.1 hypothetical protein SPPG_00792 [Spizellomyces punctatus DAOM BR117]|eukprot:XP_016613160.1 hypothetical protein SPPG_00792 [Spizellomyces punctatus DAOM BR117]